MVGQNVTTAMPITFTAWACWSICYRVIYRATCRDLKNKA